MRAAAGGLLDGRRRVAGLGVDDEVGAEPLGVRQLAVVDVDGADLQAHGLGVLDGQVAESADAGDGDPFAGPSPRSP